MVQTISPETTVLSPVHASVQRERMPIAVIWIDWYGYHIARFRAIAQHPMFEGLAQGIELVGGAGVHGKLVFRANEREGLPISTLIPDRGWAEAGQSYIARRLWAELNRLSPEVVLVPGYYTLPGLASVLWAKLHGKTAILMSESTRQDHPRKPYLEKAKRALLPRLFDAAIAGGKRQVAYVKELGFPAGKIAFQYDVVDNRHFDEGTAALRTQSTRGQGSAEWSDLPKNYFLYVGRLAPEKNIDGLIREFTRYRRRGGTWSLVLVGDGPKAPDLRRQVSEAGIEDAAIFAGMKDMQQILPYYAFAQCFVLPSWREPWGLVVNEAMSAGLPVILSDRCGCADDLLENGANGYVFDPAQPEKLAELMSVMSGLDERQRQSLGQKSREIISRYTPALWAEEVARIATTSRSIADRASN